MLILNRNAHLLLPAALVAMALPLGAQASANDDTYQGEAADRYARVRFVDGSTTIHKGEAEESLTRGTPVAEGDVLESRGRGVLQLADGTQIAFSGSTRLHIAALFQDEKGNRQVHLRLDYGRIRLSLGGEATLKVDTPSGTLSLRERAMATLEAERDRTVRVRMSTGRGTFSNNRDEVRLSAGERIAAYSTEDRLDRVRTFNTYEQDAFESWADQYAQTPRSESYQRVPREIRHYADDLDEHGEWVEVDEVGWCWRPRVSVEWRPYWRGRWGAYSGGLTWVSDDPFGFLTFHFGRWGWTSNWGWYWIPGVHYAPAWVAWNSVGTSWGWAPLNYWNAPSVWGYGAWGGGHCWNIVDVHHLHESNLNRHIYSDASRIRTFHDNRDLRAPWTRGPVVVTQAEFRNPAQLTRALNPEVRRERIQTYERQIQSTTGRSIIRREATPPSGSSGADAREHRVPFETRPQAQERREAAPPQRLHETRPLNPLQETPSTPRRDLERRAPEPREERRTETPTPRPRERGFEPVPEHREEPRSEPSPSPHRERGFESRQDFREERRPEPPRERPRESQPSESRGERPQERRVERPAPPAKESRPEPPKGDKKDSRSVERR